jgi:hypothetical protein
LQPVFGGADGDQLGAGAALEDDGLRGGTEGGPRRTGGGDQGHGARLGAVGIPLALIGHDVAQFVRERHALAEEPAVLADGEVAQLVEFGPLVVLERDVAGDVSGLKVDDHTAGLFGLLADLTVLCARAGREQAASAASRAKVVGRPEVTNNMPGSCLTSSNKTAALRAAADVRRGASIG